jgi:squalene-hopene/tetraprenyl-beta-curcumene cyclase
MRTIFALWASTVVIIGLGLTGMPGTGLRAQGTTAKAPAAEQSPPPFAADEPFAAAFSAERAAGYLDLAAVDWVKSKACVACHTMPPYLMARPALAWVGPAAPEVRLFFEDLVAERKEAFPDYLPKDARISVRIAMATALALNDRMTTGKLHPLTRKALDRLWTVQRPDGGWDWPFRDVPPIKMTEHYGVTFAALGVGLAPENYAQSAAARQGLAGIRRYLTANPPTSLHEKSMLLWLSQCVQDVLSDKEKRQILAELLSVQRPDGGWSLASLVENTHGPRGGSQLVSQARAAKGYGTEHLVFLGRQTGLYKSSLASDGYATGFAVYVARQAGLWREDLRLQKGVAWLKSHQRASGRWFTPSQGPGHSRHLISNAGTGYAVLALHACGELTRPAAAKP